MDTTDSEINVPAHKGTTTSKVTLRNFMIQALPQEKRDTVLCCADRFTDQYITAELLATVTFPETAARAATIHCKLAQDLPLLQDETLIAETAALFQQIPPDIILNCLHDSTSWIIVNNFTDQRFAYLIGKSIDRVRILEKQNPTARYTGKKDYTELIYSLYSDFRKAMTFAQRIVKLTISKDAQLSSLDTQPTIMQDLTSILTTELHDKTTAETTTECLSLVMFAMHYLATLELALNLTIKEKAEIFTQEEVAPIA